MPLFRHEVAGAVEFMPVGRMLEGGFNRPFTLSRVDDRNLLRDMLAGLRIENEGAMCIRRRASALNLINTDVNVGRERDYARVNARFFWPEL
jgi:hypothetical protein